MTSEDVKLTLEKLNEIFEEIQSHRENIKSLRSKGKELFTEIVDFRHFYDFDIPSNIAFEFHK